MCLHGSWLRETRVSRHGLASNVCKHTHSTVSRRSLFPFYSLLELPCNNPSSARNRAGNSSKLIQDDRQRERILEYSGGAGSLKLVAQG